MEALYNWVRNLTFYLIFVTVIVNLLPDKKYEKYLKFFFGMVFLLLVIQPFTRGLRIEEKIAYYFETLTLQNDAADFRKELMGAEDIRLEQMFGRYEEAVAADVKQLAETGGFYVLRVSVSLGREPDSQNFGRVTSIQLVLMPEDAQKVSGELAGEGGEPVSPVEPVEPVVIGSEESAREDARKQQGAEDITVGALRKQLLNYYDLEENDVEIQVQNRQRQVDSAADNRTDFDDSGLSD